MDNAPVLHAFNGGPSEVWPVPDRVVHLPAAIAGTYVDVFVPPDPRARRPRFEELNTAYPTPRGRTVRVDIRQLTFRPFFHREYLFEREKMFAGWHEGSRTLVLGPPPAFEQEAVELHEQAYLRDFMLFSFTIEDGVEFSQ